MNEIVILDPAGQPALRFGRPGPGPNEFASLYFVHLRRNPERIVAYDAAKEFTLDGRFLRSVKLITEPAPPVYDPHPVAGGGCLALTAGTGFRAPRGSSGAVQSTRAFVMMLDSTGTGARTLVHIGGRQQLLIGSADGPLAQYDLPYGFEPWIATDETGCFVHPIENEPGCTVRRPDGQPIVTALLPHVDTRIPRAEWAAQLDRLAHSGHAAPALPAPAHKPAFSRALL